MNNNPFADFEAEFLKPTEKLPEQPKVIDSNVNLLEAYEAHRKANPHPHYISVQDFKDQIFDKKEAVPVADKPKEKSYRDGLPAGLREAQDRNGINQTTPAPVSNDEVITRNIRNKTEVLRANVEEVSPVEHLINTIGSQHLSDFDIEPLTNDQGQSDMFGVEPTDKANDTANYAGFIDYALPSRPDDTAIIIYKDEDGVQKPMAVNKQDMSTEEFNKELLKTAQYFNCQTIVEENKTAPAGIEFPEEKRKFGRTRFNKPKAEVDGEPVKNKINASKIEQHGIVFDSKLENYMYNLLLEEEIEFDFQVEFILQEGFKYMHESIRPVAIVLDFVFKTYPVICDTKGFQMTDNKIKHKMLKHYFFQRGMEMRIEMPSSQKKCRELVHMLKNGFTIEEPLTEHAGTVRKNKLKKAGFERVGTNWVRDGVSYDPSFIMNLRNYDFGELLLRPEPENPLMSKADMIYIASKAHGKGWDHEKLRWSDDMYGKNDVMEDVFEYFEEYEEIGREKFYLKYSTYSLY